MDNTPALTTLTDSTFSGCEGLTTLSLVKVGLTTLQGSWFAETPNIKHLYAAPNGIRTVLNLVWVFQTPKRQDKMTIYLHPFQRLKYPD
jgi:hypothetical protein